MFVWGTLPKTLVEANAKNSIKFWVFLRTVVAKFMEFIRLGHIAEDPPVDENAKIKLVRFCVELPLIYGVPLSGACC